MNVVEPYTTVLNQANAYWMARLAKAAYTIHSETDLRPDEIAIYTDLKQEDPRFQAVYGASSNSAQAILVEHEDYLCMAFRGTDERLDWLDNLNIFAERVLFGEFHRGFWNAVEDIWDPLFRKYQYLKTLKRRPIFFTGHSLGGAMATIAAARFIHNDWPFTSVYTFGQPRAMTRETSRIFNVEAKARFFRFQNNNDLVTRAPARLMGYSHVGSFLYISEEQQLCNDPGMWFRFLDAVDGAVEAVREHSIDLIADHDIEKYLAAVQKWDCAF